MDFNSYLFILAFLPIMVPIYYVCNRISAELGKCVTIAASLCFIAYGKIEYLYFFAATILFNYVFGMLLTYGRNQVVKKIVLAIGIAANVSVLIFFKYTKFLFQIPLEGILIPLGISFVTFSQISYLVDAYRHKLISNSFLDYVFWVLYFPKIAQGPIVKYNVVIDELRQQKKKVPDAEHIAKGLWFIAIGLGEKVLLADNLANIVSYGYGFSAPFSNLSGLEAILVILAYTLQIYFDFGGYSHMALGISALLGIYLPDNFNRPYNATSVDDFWKRWHISLTGFLREYVYFPLGGSRKGEVRAYFNIMVIFLISGIWHGANWTFVVWGAIHGIAMCLDRLLHQVSRQKITGHLVDTIQKAIGWLITFLYVNVTWVFFRANSCKDAIALLKKAVTDRSGALSEDFLELFRFTEYKLLERWFPIVLTWKEQLPSLGVMVFFGLGMFIALWRKDSFHEFKPRLWKCIWAGVVFLWSVTSLSHVTQYIYGVF